ncbi:MAG: hypothetical protein NVS3B5_08890 [Sphingomicrobium sp.]
MGAINTLGWNERNDRLGMPGKLDFAAPAHAREQLRATKKGGRGEVVIRSRPVDKPITSSMGWRIIRFLPDLDECVGTEGRG